MSRLKSGAMATLSRRVQLDDLHSAAAVCAIPLLLAFALCGIVYGNLPLYLLFSVYVLQGIPCLAGVAATMALLAVPVLRFLRRAAPPQAQARYLRARRWALRIAASLWVLAGVIDLLGMTASRNEWMIQPLGLAASAQWPLAPLPWAWSWLAGFGADNVKRLLLVVLCVVVAVDLLVTLIRGRGYAVYVMAIIVYFAIGKVADAAGRFAAGQGFLPHSALEAGAKLAFSRDPGVYNSITWMFLWVGIGAFMAAFLVVMVAAADKEESAATRPG